MADSAFMIRSTHTVAVLDVRQSTFEEIAGKLRAAGYDHVFNTEERTIDMSGIALKARDPAINGRGDMTVEELIGKLQTMPPKATVAMLDTSRDPMREQGADFMHSREGSYRPMRPQQEERRLIMLRGLPEGSRSTGMYSFLSLEFL